MRTQEVHIVIQYILERSSSSLGSTNTVIDYIPKYRDLSG